MQILKTLRAKVSIMKNKKLVITIFSVLTVGCAFFFYRKSNNKQIESKYTEYTVAKGKIDLNILSTGVVQPQNKLEIKPPIAGRVEKIIVKEGEFVHKNQIIAWMSSIERAALLDAARSKGALSVKEWEDLYPATPIIAPINGTIIKRNVESGQTFNTADSIFTMSDRLIVKAQVDETDIAKVKLKQKVSITLDAYADQPLEATVDKIAFDATTINNVTTYIVDVLPRAVPEFMRSGMTANVTFQLLSKENVLVVPSSAVFLKEGKNYVNYLVDKKQNEKEVVVGLSDGRQIEINNGLNENEKILVPEFHLESKKGGANPFSPIGGGRRMR